MNIFLAFLLVLIEALKLYVKALRTEQALGMAGICLVLLVLICIGSIIMNKKN